ncbi:MAG: polyphosphate kinase 1 [Proteobacteria bacterium]|nr:polyphosphate kinase 1 [Pseudomonadota bacterium]MCP4917803.1 polyphosphate kinase 1 [Pseudomonadota bacterium]
MELAPHSAIVDAPSDVGRFLNRELSALEFNRRVLAQAEDPAVPLLERLRFLTIVSSNLDEFFEVRVAGLEQRVALGLGSNAPDGLLPTEVLQRISVSAQALVRRQYDVLNNQLLPQLETEDVFLLKRAAWNESQRRMLRKWFLEQALPVLTPLGLDPTHPFPEVQNKSLNFIVTLSGEDAFGRQSGLAVVQVPRALPRIVALPGRGHCFALLSSVIHAHMSELFPGMRVKACHQFRVTRNSDMWVDEEESVDLLSALQGELRRRNYGHAVRIEIADTCKKSVARSLLEEVELTEAHVYRVNGPVNLHRLGALCQLVDRPDLKYRPFVPALPDGIEPKSDLFEVLNERDVLLHHPYQSFAPVVELVRQAALDPNVVAIKQTLYRTGSESAIAEALLEAAWRGKAVCVIIELRARFDEAANIQLAERLQEAGANVVYGVVGHKCHSKMLLIVRREGKSLRRYVHLGTGNYHSGTARLYTDISYMTADKRIAADVQALFIEMSGLGKVAETERLLHSPFTLFPHLLNAIAFEAEQAALGKPCGIQARLNSLSEPQVIDAMYAASRAGVPIQLVVRGICRLRPGVPGLSENISVRSIVGRFLEHARIYRFHAAGEDQVLCASADWMERNLHRRVETAWPVDDRALKARVVEETLEAPLHDNALAWALQSDGSWERVPSGEPARACQQELLAGLADFHG